MQNKVVAIALGVVVLIVLGVLSFLVWQNYVTQVAPTTTAPTTPLTEEEAGKADLGSELYEKATNPISEKLPETVAPVPNPVQDIYKNPFE